MFEKNWLQALEERFGQANYIKEIQSEGKPKIHVFYFDALPAEGFLTAVTCGLSSAGHPEWETGTPELVVTMKTRDPSWGLAAGYFASSFHGEKRFGYGDVFKIDTPISEEGPMSAYLLFAPAFLDADQAHFALEDRKINLVAAYPIHDEEIPLYDRIGLEAFWHADGFEINNPARAPISVPA